MFGLQRFGRVFSTLTFGGFTGARNTNSMGCAAVLAMFKVRERTRSSASVARWSANTMNNTVGRKIFAGIRSTIQTPLKYQAPLGC